MKTLQTTPRSALGFTLLELLVSIGIASVMFAMILRSGTDSVRSLSVADNYSYQSNEELRAMDYIARDLRRALTVTIPTGGQSLSLTLPDTYSSYDSQGNPTGSLVTPTISGGSATYGSSTTPISVAYTVSNGKLLRAQTIQSTGAVNTLVVCSNVTDFALAFVAQSTTVTFSITFDPKYQTVSSALNAGTKLAGTVAVRAIRFQ